MGQRRAGVAEHGLYADSVNGLVTRGEPVLSPLVSSVEPAGDPVRVVVTDCGDSTNSLKYRVSDDSVVGKGTGPYRGTGVLEQFRGATVDAALSLALGDPPAGSDEFGIVDAGRGGQLPGVDQLLVAPGGLVVDVEIGSDLVTGRPTRDEAGRAP